MPLRRLEISVKSAELFNEVIRSLIGCLSLKNVLPFADCNGHPRILEKFYQDFISNKEARKIHNYSSLITILANHIREWYIALLGKSIKLSHTINTNGEKKSVSTLISSKVYINSLTKKSEAEYVIPTLSAVSLQLPTYDEVMDENPFERFHANWELLYSMLLENGKVISLCKIYGLSDKGQEKIEIYIYTFI
ncbi:6195_t:CDS:2 [Rhizophagus irregularis]|nr:6195_t:CDS:2 [Rhizophagus irregularis]